MNDQKKLFFAPLIFLGAVMLVEVFLAHWIAVQAIFVVGALYSLVAGAFFLVFRKTDVFETKNVPNEETSVGKLRMILWNGDWIKDRDPGKKRVLLFLVRLCFPLAFFYEAAFRFFSNETASTESALVFLAWVFAGFGMFAALIYKDMKDLKTKRRRASEETAEGSDGSAERDQIAQLDEWLKSGVIGKEEYETLKKKYSGKSRKP